MAEEKQEKMIKKQAPPVSELKSEGDCPYCAYEGVDPTNGLAHKKTKGKVITTENNHLQCVECGKMWSRAALGKPYSIELERGDLWAKENKAKQLLGGGSNVFTA